MSTYREVPIYMVCGPSMAWPGEYIAAIFYTEREAKKWMKDQYNPFFYIRRHEILVDESRDTATE